MRELKTIEEALDFAIDREQEAVTFYNELAINSESGQSRDILLGFSVEEASHRRKLQAVKRNTDTLPSPTSTSIFVADDQSLTVKASPDLTFKEALLLAISLEKEAASLYLDMSRSSTDESLKTLFKQLAFEETAHETRFQIIYEEECSTKKVQETAPEEQPKTPKYIPLVEDGEIIIEAAPRTTTPPEM